MQQLKCDNNMSDEDIYPNVNNVTKYKLTSHSRKNILFKESPRNYILEILIKYYFKARFR